MKTIILSVSVLVLAGAPLLPAQAQTASHNNNIGPAITFNSGQSAFGVTGRFGLAENVFDVKNTLSLRPFVRFPSSTVELGAAVTYDFDLARYNQVTPYAGVGLASLAANTANTNGNATEIAFYGQAGVEINASRDWALVSSVNVPFNNRLATTFTLGANYRF